MLKIDKIAEEHSTVTRMAKDEKQLSGVMIILIIGGGALTFIVLFIFAKRQIMRFTLRSRRGPHVLVGHDASKNIKKEIERRLDCIQKIVYEPQLIDDDSCYILQPEQSLPPYYYRLKAVDDVKILEKEIAKQDGSVRHSRDSIRSFLLGTLSGTMNDSGPRLIHQYCDMYEHARHDPNEFGNEEYEAYRRLLRKLLDAAKSLKSYTSSRKSSPSRTPIKKQTKVQSLLDPSRLKPPPQVTGGMGGGVMGSALGTNTRINYGLSMQSSGEQLVDGEQPQNVGERTIAQNIALQLEANEIMSISPGSNVI